MDWENIYQRKPDTIEEYVLKTFSKMFTESDRIFIFPEIQPSISKGAKSTYLQLKPDELLIAIFDETVFARDATDGFAFTTKRIYWKNLFDKPKEIEYQRIADTMGFSRANRNSLELAEGSYISIKLSIDDNGKNGLTQFIKEVKAFYKKQVPQPKPIIPKPTIEGESPIDLIDLNNASLDDLLKLPGITLVKANKIIEECKRRRFKTIEDVGQFLELQPHQVERLKKEAVVKPYPEPTGEIVRPGGRRVDY